MKQRGVISSRFAVLQNVRLSVENVEHKQTTASASANQAGPESHATVSIINRHA